MKKLAFFLQKKVWLDISAADLRIPSIQFNNMYQSQLITTHIQLKHCTGGGNVQIGSTGRDTFPTYLLAKNTAEVKLQATCH